jgi:hypothetical protein
MGMFIHGIFPHQLDKYEEVETLPPRLRSAVATLTKLERTYWHSERTSGEAGWHVCARSHARNKLTPRREWELGEGPVICGPASLPDGFCRLLLGRRCLIASTGIKWRAATGQPSLFLDVRQLFREIAVGLSSDVYLILPDYDIPSDLVHDGAAFDEIVSQIAKDGAEPVIKFEQLWSADSESSSWRYYLEEVDVIGFSA